MPQTIRSVWKQINCIDKLPKFEMTFQILGDTSGRVGMCFKS